MTTSPAAPAPIEPDTKDWTWVLAKPCPDCGYDAAGIARRDLGRLVRDNAQAWQRVLERPGAQRRPAAAVWSPVEYACHVRDVHRLFAERLRSMLDGEDSTFANWDQDETAVADAYHQQQAAVVAVELAAAAQQVAATYDDVPDGAWTRTGARSDGSRFTVESLGRYHLHDLVHHIWDVGAPDLAE